MDAPLRFSSTRNQQSLLSITTFLKNFQMYLSTVHLGQECLQLWKHVLSIYVGRDSMQHCVMHSHAQTPSTPF